MGRVCARCHQERSAGEFYPTNRSWCKPCVCEYERRRRARGRPPREQLPEGTKRCPACFLVQPLDQFRLRPNGKPQSWCVSCHRRLNEQLRQTKVASPRGPLGTEWADWRESGTKRCPRCRKHLPISGFAWSKAKQRPHGYCRKCSRRKHVEWLKTPAGRRSLHKYNSQPDRRRKNDVRVFTQKAIRLGYLTPKPCRVCGVTKVHAHHTDYSKPLEVEWLCEAHHQEVHRRSQRQEESQR